MSAAKNFSIERRGIVIAATVNSTAFALAGAGGDVTFVRANEDVLIYNPGPNSVAIEAGDSASVALAPGDSADFCSMVAPPSQQAFYKGRTTHLAVKAIGGAQTIYAFVGNGA